MKRTDLHENPAAVMGKLIGRARSAGESAQTRPTGILHLGDGDAVWDRPDGSWQSVKELPSAIDVEKLLTEGLSTASKKTTVSTSPAPASAEGFPEGGYWTQTQSASDSTVIGLWQVVDGAWSQLDLAGQALNAFPYADIGLLNVAVLSAEIITSGYFRTAETGKRTEVDSLGIRAYDPNGQNTVNLNGFDNLLTGGIRTAASGRRTEMLNTIWGGMWSGLRLFQEETGRPCEVKTVPHTWRDYPPGALYLTSSADMVSRGELVVARDRFNLNFEDQVTGVQTRYLEVTRSGGTAIRSIPTTTTTGVKSELALGNDSFNLNMTDLSTGVQTRYIEVARGGASRFKGPDGSGLEVSTTGVIRLESKSDPTNSGSTGLLLRSSNSVIIISDGVNRSGFFSPASAMSFTARQSSGYTFDLVGDDKNYIYPSAMKLDGNGLTLSGSRVVPSPLITTGSINDIRKPGRCTIWGGTDTPTGGAGFLEVLDVGVNVIEQRFTSNSATDWREWRRRSTSDTAWTPWVPMTPGSLVTNRFSNIEWDFANGSTNKINFDVGAVPAGMTWDAANRQLVISQGGLYNLSYMVTCSQSGPNEWYARLVVSGVGLTAIQHFGRGTANHSLPYRIAAGGTVAVEVANFSGATVHVIKPTDVTRLDVTYLGP